MPIPLRSHLGPPLQVSKWLSLSVLVDGDEMKALLSHLGDFGIFVVNGPVPLGEGEITSSDFLQLYQRYIHALQMGEMPLQDRLWRAAFSSAWATSSEVLYAYNVDEQRQLIKVERPVIQLQPHQFSYSETDGKFRSMVFGTNSILWGIQFSYPQLYQDVQMHVQTVVESSAFPNTALFKCLQRWVRQNTVATPFSVAQRRVNVPIRLGKKCFSWINKHPQLKARGLQVMAYS